MKPTILTMTVIASLLTVGAASAFAQGDARPNLGPACALADRDAAGADVVCVETFAACPGGPAHFVGVASEEVDWLFRSRLTSSHHVWDDSETQVEDSVTAQGIHSAPLVSGSPQEYKTTVFTRPAATAGDGGWALVGSYSSSCI